MYLYDFPDFEPKIKHFYLYAENMCEKNASQRTKFQAVKKFLGCLNDSDFDNSVSYLKEVDKDLEKLLCSSGLKSSTVVQYRANYKNLLNSFLKKNFSKLHVVRVLAQDVKNNRIQLFEVPFFLFKDHGELSLRTKAVTDQDLFDKFFAAPTKSSPDLHYGELFDFRVDAFSRKPQVREQMVLTCKLPFG